MKMSIGQKIGGGFAVVLAIMVCSAGLTYWKISDMRGRQEAMIDLRIPSLTYSLDTAAQFNQSSNEAREYILMADDHQAAAKARNDLEDAEKNLDR